MFKSLGIEPIVFGHDRHEEDRGSIGVYFSQSTYDRAEWPFSSEKINKEEGYYLDVKKLKLVEDRYSKSYYGGVRGFHGDTCTWKYITCLHGKIKLVTWDLILRRRRIYYLEEGNMSILIPPKFLNAHQCLTDSCIFHYKQSVTYDKVPANEQWSIYYNDKTIGPYWSIEPRRVSERDKNAQTLEEFYKTWKDS